MQIDARTATAADFDATAHRHANTFWVWLIVSAIVFYMWNWWAILPAVFAAAYAIFRVSATVQAKQLRKGTYKIPNPNNGAPDGDARNYKSVP